MHRKILLLFLLAALSMQLLAQYDCKVLVKELEGQYNGSCKKGLADGEGSARGIDSYIGEFKKGLPNGFGIYTYQNGSMYVGVFKKGLKDGYGFLQRLTESGDIKEDYGWWLADSLIVPNDTKALFRIKERKGIKVIDPTLKRDKALKNEVWINFKIDGVPDKTVEIHKAEISSGKQIDTRDRSLNTLVAFSDIEEFPVTFRLEYEIRQPNHFEKKQCEVEIMLFTKGLWEIDLNH